jgi:hypothetical protein
MVIALPFKVLIIVGTSLIINGTKTSIIHIIIRRPILREPLASSGSGSNRNTSVSKHKRERPEIIRITMLLFVVDVSK